MNKVTLLKGDCLEKLKELEANSVDSVVTDPPYEIGFMGKGWDDSGIANNPELWKEVLRVLKPGGHLLSFSHSRTYHRQAVAVEDAGFEIRDQIMWIYGSGFPKSHNIGKALDKMEGNEREVVGYKKRNEKDKKIYGGDSKSTFTDNTIKALEITKPVGKNAQQYEGWGTALKPAHEPIVMARKPFKGNVANNVLEWGTGGINVDGCRVAYQSEADEKSSIPGSLNSNQKNSLFGMGEGHEHNTEGRFPANIIFDEEAGKILDEQSGITYSGPTKPKRKYEGVVFGGGNSNKNYEANSGGASRFFYCPKSSKKDRNEGNTTNVHPTVKPTDLMGYLIRLITPKGGLVLDPFMGSGSTGKAAVREGMSFIGIEREDEYMEIAKSRIEHEQRKNKHQDFFDI